MTKKFGHELKATSQAESSAYISASASTEAESKTNVKSTPRRMDGVDPLPITPKAMDLD